MKKSHTYDIMDMCKEFDKTEFSKTLYGVAELTEKTTYIESCSDPIQKGA